MNQYYVVENGDMSADIISSALDLSFVRFGSIHAVFTGSPNGSLSLEFSNDIIEVGSDPSSAVVNWTAYSGSSYSLSSSGQYMFNISNMGYRWLRLVYTATSGSGVLNAIAAVKNDY